MVEAFLEFCGFQKMMLRDGLYFHKAFSDDIRVDIDPAKSIIIYDRYGNFIGGCKKRFANSIEDINDLLLFVEGKQRIIEHNTRKAC